MVLLLFAVGIGIARELGKRHNALCIRGTDTKQMIDLCASHVYSHKVMEY